MQSDNSNLTCHKAYSLPKNGVNAHADSVPSLPTISPKLVTMIMLNQFHSILPATPSISPPTGISAFAFPQTGENAHAWLICMVTMLASHLGVSAHTDHMLGQITYRKLYTPLLLKFGDIMLMPIMLGLIISTPKTGVNSHVLDPFT